MMDSIFDDDDAGLFGDVPQTLSTLKIGDIEPNKSQPRKDFNNEALQALADSIIEHGIIQPLTVRPMADGRSYQIVAGERRWRAAKIAGLTEVPVRIMELSDAETAEIALIENLQREDLNPIEEAMGYQQLMDAYSMRQEDVAKRVGKSRSSVANALRIMQLPAEVIALVKDGELSTGHCKAILSVNDQLKQITLGKKTAAEGLSVRETERLARLMNQGEKPETAKPKKDVFLVEAEISLTERIGKPVAIKKGKDRYSLSIDCKTEDELKELIHFIAGDYSKLTYKFTGDK